MVQGAQYNFKGHRLVYLGVLAAFSPFKSLKTIFLSAFGILPVKLKFSFTVLYRDFTENFTGYFTGFTTLARPDRRDAHAERDAEALLGRRKVVEGVGRLAGNSRKTNAIAASRAASSFSSFIIIVIVMIVIFGDRSRPALLTKYSIT